MESAEVVINPHFPRPTLSESLTARTRCLRTLVTDTLNFPDDCARSRRLQGRERGQGGKAASASRCLQEMLGMLGAAARRGLWRAMYSTAVWR